MVATHILVLSTCLHVALCLPLFSDSSSETSHKSRYVRSPPPPPPPPILSRLGDDAPLMGQWDVTLLTEGDQGERRRGTVRQRRSHRYQQLDDLNDQRPDLQMMSSRLFQRDFAKRSERKESEDGRIPAMGLGVLSNMNRFFEELRTNLDSVESLSQDEGPIRQSIDPSDFMALLAKQAREASGESYGSHNTIPIRNLMFGYSNDAQPYGHSGLGK